MSLQVVKTSILNEESRRKDKGVFSQTESNVAQRTGRRRNRQRSPQIRDKSQARCKSRGKLTCFYCGKPRHFQKDCRHLKKDKDAAKDVKPRIFFEENGTFAIGTSEEEILFICEQASTHLACEESTWVIDSGPSFHITPSREFFLTYTTRDHGYVEMRDNGERKIVSVGNVYLTTSTRWGVVSFYPWP